MKIPYRRRALLLAACLAVSAAPADDAAGVIKVCDGEVSLQRGGDTLAATPGTLVQPADVLVTGEHGRVGVTFRDNSLLSLGPNSRLVIDSFRFDATTHEGGFESTLKQGRLAVVSGKIAKHAPDAMKVRTPASILGVRGTEFVVEAGARP